MSSLLQALIIFISLLFGICVSEFEWYTSETTLPNEESDHASCIDSFGRLHIVGGAAGDDPIRRIDLNKISFSQGKDKMYINDQWEMIDEYPDYTDARNLRLNGPLYTKTNGKIYMIPIIFDTSKPRTTKSPPLIVYNCETAKFIPYQSYNYMPIHSINGDYGGYLLFIFHFSHFYYS